ncbi:MAG: HNH endonuclease, partial [Syntrophobacteraceae bacterium]
TRKSSRPGVTEGESFSSMHTDRKDTELRTESGWQIMTKFTGMPELPVGVYFLASARQAPEHDRVIPDHVRRKILQRDAYKCRNCGWSHKEWNPSDPRHLEAHHISPHIDGGENKAENLITLCNVCHDETHRR